MRRAPLFPDFSVRQGLATGQCGNALIGDAVIVASRIQELNKTAASDILVSASTWERVSRRDDFVELGAMMLRGRAADVTVYQLR